MVWKIITNFVGKLKFMLKMKQNTFSLFDFCKKHAGKMEIYGEETLDEEGNLIPFIDQAAIITHYLQLNKRGVDLPYRKKAEEILGLWHDFIKGQSNKKEGIVAESNTAFQQFLFPDLFQAPFQAPRNPKFKFIDLFAGIGAVIFLIIMFFIWTPKVVGKVNRLVNFLVAVGVFMLIYVLTTTYGK